MQTFIAPFTPANFTTTAKFQLPISFPSRSRSSSNRRPRTQPLTIEVNSPNTKTAPSPSCLSFESHYQSYSNERVLPLLTVPTDAHLPTPGETCFIDIPLEVLRRLEQSSSRDLALAASSHLDNTITNHSHDNAPNFSKTATLLTILRLDPTSIPTSSPTIMVHAECRCPSRLHLPTSTYTPIYTPTSTSVHTVTAIAFHDEPVRSYSERVALAEHEWQVWLLTLENSRLLRRLASSLHFKRPYDDHVRVWAPKTYDRLIAEHDWNLTPDVTRQVWWNRAESFSFAVVRAVHPESLKDVMGISCTIERLNVAMRCLENENAAIHAKISLKDALG